MSQTRQHPTVRIVKCNCTRERDNKRHYNRVLQIVRQVKGMGLTVAFAGDLAKHAPLDLYCLMRFIATGDQTSLQLADAQRAGQRYLQPLSSVEMKTRRFEKIDALSARPGIEVQFITAMFFSKAHRSTALDMASATLFVPSFFVT